MATDYWFRWFHGTVHDPKWKVIAARATETLSRKVTIGHVVAVWAAMLECASQSTPRGGLDAWVDEDVAAGLDLTEAEVHAIREAMAGKTLVDGVLVAWAKRQPLREDATAIDRKRAQRQREHAGDVVAGTPSPAMSRSVTLDKKIEEEKKKQDQEPCASPKGSRLPANWVLPTEWRYWAAAERPDLDIDREAALFADYWRGVAGSKGRKADWLATWRNWVRRAESRRGVPHRVGDDVFAGAQ